MPGFRVLVGYIEMYGQSSSPKIFPKIQPHLHYSTIFSKWPVFKKLQGLPCLVSEAIVVYIETYLDRLPHESHTNMQTLLNYVPEVF